MSEFPTYNLSLTGARMNMKAASFLIGITIFGVIMLITPIPVNAQASPCTCKDRADLINQLNRANAAYSVVKYLYFQRAMGDHLNRPVNELLDGENPGNLNYKDVIDGELSDDVNAVNDPKASTIVIKTDASTCEPTVSASTACLKSLAEKLAPRRKEFCIKQRDGFTSGRYMTVSDYLDFLERLYKDEIAEIVARLSALQKSCRPADWIGTIKYSFDQRNFNKNEKPGVVETIEDTLKIDGIIRLNGDHALEYPSSWEATGKYDELKKSNGSLPCKGGLATAKLDGKYESKHIFKWDKNGQISRDTDVSIGDVQEGNKVTIDFRIPKIVLKTSGYSRDSYNTDCPKPNGNFDGPSTPWDVEFPLDSQMINFVGSYFPGNPDKISGSVTLESGKTGTVIVTYNLFKLKP